MFPAPCSWSFQARNFAEQAYKWVQRNAMRSFHDKQDFKGLLLANTDIMNVLTPAEVERR